jgi:DNA replication and repair protein RecF
MISSLEIQSLRNIRHLSLKLSKGVNVFYGDNGSGKSSILEAIHLLGRGRSFRTSSIDDIVQVGQSNLIVRAEMHHGATVAIQKGDANIGKINAKAASFSKIAEQVPILFMDSNSHRRFFDESAYRRRFFDWILFHVKPGYTQSYKTYSKVLKMRNLTLKQGGSVKEWDSLLAPAGLELMTARKELVESFNAISDKGEHVDYKSSGSIDFMQCLNASIIDDRRARVTTIGPHRDDYLYYNGGKLLSQGQLKLAYTGLLCATKRLLSEHKEGVVILLDDICAELSIEAREKVVAQLDGHSDQLLITGVLERDLVELNADMMFHVEHGRVSGPCV